MPVSEPHMRFVMFAMNVFKTVAMADSRMQRSLCTVLRNFFATIGGNSFDSTASVLQIMKTASPIRTTVLTESLAKRVYEDAAALLSHPDGLGIQMDKPASKDGTLKPVMEDITRYRVFGTKVLDGLYPDETTSLVEDVLPMLVLVLLASVSPEKGVASPMNQLKEILSVAGTGGKLTHSVKLRRLMEVERKMASRFEARSPPPNLIREMVQTMESNASDTTANPEQKVGVIASLIETVTH